MLLPDEAQEGFRAEGAEPVDRVALTRILITDYCLGPREEEDEFHRSVRTIAATFWTEHSSRASLPTMGRSIGVEKAKTDKLGDWASRLTTSDEYIRCGREDVAKTQGLVAAKVKEALNTDEDTPDPFGELWVIGDLVNFIGERDTSMDLAKVREFVQDWSIFRKVPHGPLPLKDKVVVRYEAESSEEWWPKKTSLSPRQGLG